jgi:hypothetical protein
MTFRLVDSTKRCKNWKFSRRPLRGKSEKERGENKKSEKRNTKRGRPRRLPSPPPFNSPSLPYLFSNLYKLTLTDGSGVATLDFTLHDQRLNYIGPTLPNSSTAMLRQIRPEMRCCHSHALPAHLHPIMAHNPLTLLFHRSDGSTTARPRDVPLAEPLSHVALPYCLEHSWIRGQSNHSGIRREEMTIQYNLETSMLSSMEVPR